MAEPVERLVITFFGHPCMTVRGMMAASLSRCATCAPARTARGIAGPPASQ